MNTIINYFHRCYALEAINAAGSRLSFLPFFNRNKARFAFFSFFLRIKSHDPFRTTGKKSNIVKMLIPYNMAFELSLILYDHV